MQLRATVTLALSALLITTSPLAAGQATNAAPKLPPAIEAAFKAAYPKATIKAVHQQKYGGKDAYEIESVDNGKTRDIVYNVDGAVAMVVEEIPAADVPKPVLAAVKKDYPKATVTRYKRTKESGATSYKAELKGAKDTTAEYSPDGKRK